MISKTFTVSNVWMDWFLITTEVSSNKSLPTIEIVWMADTSVKESKERIRSAFSFLDIQIPSRKFVVNLSPSNIKKTWNRYDLPIAIWILWLVLDNIDKKLMSMSIFAWELWLDGKLKPVNWIIPIVLTGKSNWYKYFFLPKDNIQEASFIDWVDIIWIESLKDIIDIITWNKEIKPEIYQKIEYKNIFEVDFENIKWNFLQKRWMMIAAAWMHNILMVWAPWSWKTMLAKAIKSILPPMEENEILETSMIYSIKWLLDKTTPIIDSRPYRSVHHTASSVSIIWWWSLLHPGEISLSNNWILFFDELAEFPRKVLEVLRQPIEDWKIIISRANWSTTYPANFMFVAAMNPCKCGFYQDKMKKCTCSLNEVKRYQWKISWPLLDRFDIILEVPRQDIDKILSKTKEESSEQIRQKVMKAREKQKERFKNEDINFNSQMNSKTLQKYCPLDDDIKEILKRASEKFYLSARSVHRTIKLARTLADIENCENIEKPHILEALQYRNKNYFIENL